MKIPNVFRRTLYAAALSVFVSGIVWEVFDRFILVATEIGMQKHPLQPWMLRFHGAAALFSVFLFGHLFSSHIRPGWRAGRRRLSGSGLALVITILILSGYLLYYSSGDDFRVSLSFLHFWLGTLAPLPFLLHLFLRKTTTIDRH